MTDDGARAGLRIHASVYGAVNSLLLAAWLAGPRRVFWPIFPMVGWGSGLVAHALSTKRRPPSSGHRTHPGAAVGWHR